MVKNFCTLTSEGLSCPNHKSDGSNDFWVMSRSPSRPRRGGGKTLLGDGKTPTTALLVSFPVLQGLRIPEGVNLGWYKVNLLTAGTLQAHTHASPSSSDTLIGLYGQDGTLITSNDDHLSYRAALSSFLEIGTYFVVFGLWNMQFANNFEVTHAPYSQIPQETNELVLNLSFGSLGNRGFKGLFNTGQNITDGIIDHNYICTYRDNSVNFPATRISSSQVPSDLGGYFAPGYTWSENDEESGWISFGDTPATYIVQMTFDLTGYDHTSASLSLLIQSQFLSTVYVNPTSSFAPADNIMSDQSNATDQWPSSRMKNGGFQPGRNFIFFKFFHYDPVPLTMNLRATGTAVPV